MDLWRNPETVDRLASSYALGTLRGGARRRFETLARKHPPVRAAALTWQARIGGIGELQVPEPPHPNVWIRIDNLVRAQQQLQARRPAEPAPAQRHTAQARRGPAALAWWRGAALAGACASVLAVVIGWSLLRDADTRVAQLQARLLATPQTAYVAVLQDDKSSASMLVTFDPVHHRLTLQRVGPYQEALDRSLQLWALPRSGAPRSLGVLEREPLARLAAGEADVQGVASLAISLEPRGGVPSAGGPTGPVLFSGTLIRKLP